MREILFRGRRLEVGPFATERTGEWIFGHYVKDCCGEYIHSIMCSPRMVKVDPATVGQYTGLEDGTGAKIFEHDIFQDDETGELFLVSIYDGMTQFSGEDSTDDWPADIAINGSVIGNIHDNPELMKGDDGG